MGPRGIWRTDGMEYAYIDNDAIQAFISESINLTQRSQTFAWHNPLMQDVSFWWCGQGSDVINRGAVFRYANETWTVVDFARSAGTSGAVFQFPITGDLDGNILLQSEGSGLASSPDDPLNIPAAFGVTMGYGHGGYGGSGYGGVDNGIG